ncbi:MAG TPA: pitrilysin family protein [Bryobacteraceae bacterium]|nr:pitrilysin family protein [Bryobacteraceae bacterium]
MSEQTCSIYGDEAANHPAPAGRLQVPVEYFRLPNGLAVALSLDCSTPVAAVTVYYGVGFRREPLHRAGFAHLFEHLMFQGSPSLPRSEFIRLIHECGGTVNGSTRFDFTSFYEVVPSNALRTVLWAEADRMRGLALTPESLANQQSVVCAEVGANIHNQPYGGFPWFDVPQTANVNPHNAHNFYGEIEDITAATLTEAEEFFREFYRPNNAALAIVGNFDPAAVREWIAGYFGSIPSAAAPVPFDVSEPRQLRERYGRRLDRLAPSPALAIAYHMPDRNTDEYFAMGVLDHLLLQGGDSLFQKELVNRRGMTDLVRGGINILGTMFNYNGPMLWTVHMFHDRDVRADDILEAVDGVVAGLTDGEVCRETLDRALVKMRSTLYDQIESSHGLGLADMLAAFALFDGSPERINSLDARFRSVTPALLRRTAAECLRKTNRTVLEVEAPAGSAVRPMGKECN